MRRKRNPIAKALRSPHIHEKTHGKKEPRVRLDPKKIEEYYDE